jgi:hypothetical protein
MKKIILAIIFQVVIITWAHSQCNRYSLSFDSSSYVSVNDTGSLRGGQLTMCIYYKTSSTVIQALFTKNKISDASAFQYGGSINHTYFNPLRTYAITTAHNGACQVGQGYSTMGPASGYVPVNIWQQMVFTYDGVTQKLYVNGILVNSSVINKGNIQNCAGGNLLFGINALTGPAWFVGQMDEISVYNRALSQAEITTRRNTILNIANENGLVAYYRFEEGKGTVTNDLSGNGNHGTLVGCKWSTDVPFKKEFNTHLNLSGNQAICADTTLHLQAPDSNTFIYQWYKDTFPVNQSSGINVSQPGNYYAVIMDIAGGCIKNTDTTTLTVYSLPSIPHISGPIIINGSNILAQYYSDNTSSFTRLWTAVSGSIQGLATDTSVQVLWGGTGTYSLQLSVEDGHGCRNKQNIAISNHTGIEQQLNPGSCFKLYPNPVDGDDLVVITNDDAAYSIEIYNYAGVKMMTTFMQKEKLLNIDSLASGSYFVVLRGNGICTARKFVKI